MKCQPCSPAGRLVSVALCIALMFAVMFSTAALAAAQTESVIHEFDGTDGSNPYSLAAAGNGMLFGTTPFAGAKSFGCVFRLSPPVTEGDPWQETTLHCFTGKDGANPYGSVVLNPKTGKIYGTAYSGALGYGAVYELDPPVVKGDPWTSTVLYSFTGGRDGAFPYAGLISDGKGNLYGTTSQGGGPSGSGVVFRLSPPKATGGAWTQKILYRFRSGKTDGTAPFGNLIFDSAGALYGTTRFGGDTPCAGGCGAVFKLSPPITGGGPWTESALYFFQGTDGLFPYSNLIFDSSGSLYGTTLEGGQTRQSKCCGTVFQLTPPAGGNGLWTEAVLYNFNLQADGTEPAAGLVFDSAGVLYGTTTAGGIGQCFNGCGSVFKLSPPAVPGGTWNEEPLHLFAGGIDGASPWGPVLLLGDTFYGTTINGGSHNAGTVFQITP